MSTASTTWVLTFVLAASPPESSTAVAEKSSSQASPAQQQTQQGDHPQGLPDNPRDSQELREAHRDVLQRSARRAKPDFEEVVPELVALYAELEEIEGMAHAQTVRIRQSLEARLEQIHDHLTRDNLRRRREAERVQRRRRGGPSPAARTGRVAQRQADLPGGGELARATELIELIQNTIAPETWQVNGGKGSISYYAPLRVLVIRQTGEVHHQLGGALPRLRP